MWHLRAASPWSRGGLKPARAQRAVASNLAAFPHRWGSFSCIRPERSRSLDAEPRGKDDGLGFGRRSRCPAASGSATASRACATTTPWASGTPGRFPRCDERCRSSTAWRCRFLARCSTAAPGALVDLRTGHRGHAGPQLEPLQLRRYRCRSLLLDRHVDGRRLEARRHVVLLHKVRRRRGGAQSGPGADNVEAFFLFLTKSILIK